VATLTSAEAFHVQAVEGSSTGIWSSTVLWLVAFAFLLYCSLEGSLSSWASSYLAQLGYTERRAGLLVGSFWFAFIASRLGAAYFEYYYVDGGEPWVLITLACLTAVAIAGLAGTRHRPHAVLWLLLIGLVLGPVFPNLIGILYRHFGEGEMGAAYGAMILIGGAGSLIFPPIMNAYADRTSLRVALRLTTVISILLAGGSLVLALVK
jgi:fucose permease